MISSHAEQPWSISPASGAIKDRHDAMYESEQRRLVLVEKLREAHETLQVFYKTISFQDFENTKQWCNEIENNTEIQHSVFSIPSVVNNRIVVFILAP